MATADPKPNLTPTLPVGTTPPPSVPALRPSQPAESPKRRWWLWGLAGAISLAVVGVATSSLWMSVPPVVAVEHAAFAPVTRVLAVNGRVAAVNSVDIRPVVTGTVIALPVAEGDEIVTGQTLAQIDAAAQDTIVRQAVAAMDAAIEARQQASEAYDRSVALGANVARSVREANAHSLQLATQDVVRLTAALDQAVIGLENHTLRAPVAGTVLTLGAELGQLVGPTSPVLTLADLRDLVVETDVDEAYATQIALNQPAILQLAGETGTRAGHVSFVSARVDEATGGLAIKMAFDAPVIAPIGLTVTANIVVDQRDAALTVPRTALRSDAEGAGVLVVRDGTAQLQRVTLVDWPAARLIVTDGLAVGDVVITDATGIADGQAVAVEQR